MSYDLDENLYSSDRLGASDPFVPGVDFDINNDRGIIDTAKIREASITNAKIGTAVIGTANIGTLSFNEITGGTATLGGTNNGQGVLIINDQGGTNRLTANGTAIVMYNAAGQQEFLLDYNQEYTSIRSLKVFSAFSVLVSLGGTFIYSLAEDQADFRRSLFFSNERFIQLGGTTTPSAPSGSQVKLYTDVSGGKTRLMARFGSGTAVQVAIEP